MLKHANAAAVLALTTGAAIAIGTNVDVSGVYVGSAATTVTIKGGAAGTTTILEVSGNVSYNPPIAIAGPANGTSSGGSFYVTFIPR